MREQAPIPSSVTQPHTGESSSAPIAQEQAKPKDYASQRNYLKTEKGKAAAARYKQSPKGRAKDYRYNHSEKGKAAHERHLQKKREGTVPR